MWRWFAGFGGIGEVAGRTAVLLSEPAQSCVASYAEPQLAKASSISRVCSWIRSRIKFERSRSCVVVAERFLCLLYCHVLAGPTLLRERFF